MELPKLKSTREEMDLSVVPLILKRDRYSLDLAGSALPSFSLA